MVVSRCASRRAAQRKLAVLWRCASATSILGMWHSAFLAQTLLFTGVDSFHKAAVPECRVCAHRPGTLTWQGRIERKPGGHISVRRDMTLSEPKAEGTTHI